MAEILPAIFFGHGNPMNAVRNNSYTEAWRRVGIQTPRQRLSCRSRLIGLCQEPPSQLIRRPGQSMTLAAFQELYQVRYPAPGDPELARRVRNCSRPCRSSWTNRGVLIMALGRFFGMCILMPMFHRATQH